MSSAHVASGVSPLQTETTWTPHSWHDKVALQQPNYPDLDKLQDAVDEVRSLPPLVTSWEILSLQSQIAEAQEGKRFLLQGGDCAEIFADCTNDVISNRLKVLLQMSLVLVHGLRVPVVRVGRFAGQYAKPRSADLEVRDGKALPSYRGDIINSPEFTEEARTPDPRRMIRAHARSAMTLNFVRALIDGGFADLHHPEYWDLAWMKDSPLLGEYQRMVDGVRDSVQFMETLSGHALRNMDTVDFYTSHEALLLPYEEAVTREVPRQTGWFNMGTHFPWIGMRTAADDGAHLEYMRGIRNPIAVKVGPSVTPDALRRVIARLNPDNLPGRLTLIHRMGVNEVEAKLPPLLRSVQADGSRVLWVCDPMHGNTETAANGLKTRRFDNIRGEIERSFDVHAACGTRLGGVHLELTGENVTECTGGARALTDLDLERDYRTTVDPRLNDEQALELAMCIVRNQSKT